MNIGFKWNRKNIILLLGVVVALFIGISTLIYGAGEQPGQRNTIEAVENTAEEQSTISVQAIYSLAEKGQRLVQFIRNL